MAPVGVLRQSRKYTTRGAEIYRILPSRARTCTAGRQEGHGPSQNLDCVARLLAKRVETVIPLQVNSVARLRTLEPFLCGLIQRVGRIGEAGQEAEL